MASPDSDLQGICFAVAIEVHCGHIAVVRVVCRHVESDPEIALGTNYVSA